MRIDAHLHVWRAIPTNAPVIPTVVTGQCDVPTDLAVAYMDEHGIDRAVLVQPVYPGEDNSYVADAAAAQPDRFAAVCVVDPRTPNAAERLAYWVTERGCKGVRLRPRIPAESGVFGSPPADPVWECATRLGIVVSVLAGCEHLATVAALAERFPDVPIVIDHMAHPDPSEGVEGAGFRALLALARHKSVRVKVSGYYHFSQEPYPYRDAWDLTRALYESFGPRRLLWGSDFPHVLLKSGYRRSLMLAERFFDFLGPTDLERILGENAAELYWP